MTTHNVFEEQEEEGKLETRWNISMRIHILRGSIRSREWTILNRNEGGKKRREGVDKEDEMTHPKVKSQGLCLARNAGEPWRLGLSDHSISWLTERLNEKRCRLNLPTQLIGSSRCMWKKAYMECLSQLLGGRVATLWRLISWQLGTRKFLPREQIPPLLGVLLLFLKMKGVRFQSAHVISLWKQKSSQAVSRFILSASSSVARRLIASASPFSFPKEVNSHGKASWRSRGQMSSRCAMRSIVLPVQKAGQIRRNEDALLRGLPVFNVECYHRGHPANRYKHKPLNVEVLFMSGGNNATLRLFVCYSHSEISTDRSSFLPDFFFVF